MERALPDLHGRRNDTYAAWREGDRDDLVLAVAVAAWYAVQYMHGRIGISLL